MVAQRTGGENIVRKRSECSAEKKNMAVEVFDNRETDYQSWLTNNPNAYVLNVNRHHLYFALHRSSCPLISRYTAAMDQARAFTCNNEYKICSDQTAEQAARAELLVEIQARGGTGFDTICRCV